MGSLVAVRIAAGEPSAIEGSSGDPGLADSGAAWLPDPVEQLDAPEVLDQPRGAARFRLVAGSRGEGPPAKRRWQRASWSSSRVDAAIGREGDAVDGGLLLRWRDLALGAGSLAISDAGVAGEIAGLTRRTRSVGVSRRSDARRELRAATGASTDLRGAAVAWRDHVRMTVGRRARGQGGIAAVDLRAGWLDAHAAMVRLGERREVDGGASARWETKARGRARAARCEFGAGPSGPIARLEGEAREGRLRAATRYQFEPARDRPATLDIEGSWSARTAGARVRWRSWTAAGAPRSMAAAVNGPPDDGWLDADFRVGAERGADGGAWRLRLGSKPRQRDGSGGDRYAIGEWIVARDEGRTFRLTAGRREVQRGDGWRHGRSLGARIEWAREGAALALSVDAVRAKGGGASYGTGFEVAEGGSLRSRTRSGLRMAGRGWVRAGAWRVGAAADADDAADTDETTTGARRAPRVTLWLTWGGGAATR